MKHGRRKPYSMVGISRLPCSRCGAKPSVHQWQICSDGNLYRPLCLACDIDLQRVVLEWIGDPDCAEKVERYRAAQTAVD